MLAFKNTVVKDTFIHELNRYDVKNEDDLISLEEFFEDVIEKLTAGQEELRPLYFFLSAIIDKYHESLPQPEGTGADMLRFMMDQNGHKQKDLTSVMGRSTVSEVLNGHRELTPEQMRNLGKFYNMNPALFLGTKA